MTTSLSTSRFCRSFKRSLSVFLTLLFGAYLHSAQAQSKFAPEGADKFIQRLRTVVTDAGGDLEKNRFHFVFAFNTSHFGEDGIQAGVMRTVATRTAEKLLMPGDTSSIASWDMTVWDFKNPVTLRGDSESEVGKEILPLPTAPRNDSHGGHDTEQSIVDLIAKVKTTPNQGRDAIVVLFVNDEHSQMPEAASANDRLLGSNAPAYQQVLSEYNRLPKEIIPYQVTKQTVGNQPLERKVEAIILVPKQIAATPLASGTRSEWHKAHLQSSGGLPIGLILGLLALLAIGAALFFLFPKLKGGKKLSNVQIGDRRLLLSADGQVTRLTGPRFSGAQSGDTELGREGDGTPPALLGKVELLKNKVVVTTEGDLNLSYNATEGRRFELGAGEHLLKLTGNVQTNPDLPPDRFETNFNVAVS